MLARECRSTASNARARTIHSLSAVAPGEVGAVGERRILAPGTSRRGGLLAGFVRVKLLQFQQIFSPPPLGGADVCEPWVAGAAPFPRGRVPGPRRPGGVRRPWGARV